VSLSSCCQQLIEWRDSFAAFWTPEVQGTKNEGRVMCFGPASSSRILHHPLTRGYSTIRDSQDVCWSAKGEREQF
jgi:hypothetical protein